MVRLWVALDVPDVTSARRWMEQLAPHRAFKIGMQLFYQAGPEFVRQAVREGYEIFLDLKLLDIPQTVERAVLSLQDLGVSLLTVHSWGGADMLARAKRAATTLDLIAVTVLTSLTHHELAALGIDTSVDVLVDHAILAARTAGLAGIVLSGGELAAARSLWPEARRVVPGIRWAERESDDQRRVIDPPSAVRLGATDLVVGRAILAEPDPWASYQRILRSVDNVSQ